MFDAYLQMLLSGLCFSFGRSAWRVTFVSLTSRDQG
jgi:hypothetical protein